MKRAVCENKLRPFEIDELVVFGKFGNTTISIYLYFVLDQIQ